ncbi:3-hydroxy-3-methylglutaryl-coenzyme A (HMG-CoA) reductase isozyme, partial [Tulasnella sp. UAMH 9824]
MAPTLPLVRPILRVLSRAASAKPIETVVVTFCLTTYAYFLCLQAVKHSSFLSPSSPYSDLKPAYAIPSKDGSGEWTAVEEDVWSSPATNAWSKVELQQVVVALDSNHRAFGRSSPLPASFYDLTTPFVHSALSNFTGYLTSTGSSGNTFPALCYPSPTDPASCLSSLDLPTSQTRSTTFTLAFRPPPSNRQRWASDMSGRIFTSGDVKFVIGRREERIDQMRSATWVGYAFRAFFWRFWDLARNADSMDIFVVLIGYLMMHWTFVNLYFKGRQLGSHVWLGEYYIFLLSSIFHHPVQSFHFFASFTDVGLRFLPALFPNDVPFAFCLLRDARIPTKLSFPNNSALATATSGSPATTTLTSSVFAFVLSVPVSLLVGIPFDPVALSEALPFLVITVAFDKPLRLAQSVFSHPALYAHSQVSSLKGNTAKAGGRMTFKPATEIIQDAVEAVGEGIVRDYAVEVVLLLLGSLAGVAGLKEFCALAALILIADCVMLFTFYVALLNIFVEVRRVKLIRRTMKRRATGEADVPSTPLISERPSPISGPKASTEGEVVDPENNRALRLKFILISAFLTLHILNIFTTLTPA